MKHQQTFYNCEKCNEKIDSPSSLNIVTPLKEDEYWSRLHVRIIHRYGVHNNSKEEYADLCQTCTIALLVDALSRVRNGERASKGTEDPGQKGWEKP